MLELVLSLTAVIISLATLYFAHLKGPNIILVSLPTQQEYRFSLMYSDPPAADINFHVLFSNTGGGSGVLLDVKTTVEQQQGSVITSKVSNPEEERLQLEGWIPIPIKSGESYYARIWLLIEPIAKGLDDTLKSLSPICMKVHYKVTSWRGIKTKESALTVDLAKLIQGINST